MRSKICGVYKITSPTGKVYTGEAVDIKRRWSHYRGLYCKRQPRLYNSLVFHTALNHTFEVIEECCKEDLKCRERHWQDVFDVTGQHGLNCQLSECGEKKQTHSQETIEKIRQANTGRKYTDETVIKMTIAAKNRQPASEEHRKNLSIANSGIKNGMCGKKGPASPAFGKPGMRGNLSPLWGRKGPLHHSFDRKTPEDETLKRVAKLYKPVLDLSTGVFYTSCLDASNYHPFTAKRLSAMLSGSRPNRTSLAYA